ncbi:hypothetical protein [Aneurinibacillus migulanus]|uniref:hypothetical protein n=1 Tax=Aneurinibacillus migulanus TaxID=47500 RepID=UPI00209CF847|nr:hypothetical protein [Aneurinibacillus migulanus]MCP1355472.1 hypothetical protein [Aneurinibacillus migulanus]
MADLQKLKGTDTLRQMWPKVNANDEALNKELADILIRLNNILSNQDSNPEVVDARLGADGVIRATLGILVREIHAALLEIETTAILNTESNVITDVLIGDRTVDPTQAPTGNVGTLTQQLSWIANRLKAITGKTNWYDNPAITLESINTTISNLTNTYAKKVQEAWIKPTLLSGWTNFESDFAKTAYMKDELGFVHVKGLIKSGLTNTPVFIFPSGYRPIERNVFIAMNGESSGGVRQCRIDIFPDGSVLILNITENVFVNLNGIIFRAEQ